MTSEISKEELDILDLLADLEDGEALPDLEELLGAEHVKQPTPAVEAILLSDAEDQHLETSPQSADNATDEGGLQSSQLFGLTLLYDDTLGDDGNGGSVI